VDSEHGTVIDSGLTTMVQPANSTVLGYQLHGVLQHKEPVTTVHLSFSGDATLNGYVRYRIE
jgi:hypothetical protein